MEIIEHHERRQFNSEMFTTLTQISGDIGQIKGTLEGLAGDQGRITKLEQAQDKAETRQWVHTAVILPVVSAVHVIAHKFGL